MSKEFLLKMNGDNRGLFFEYLMTRKSTPRILWYPAAGDDYRALFYLRPEYNVINPAEGKEPAPPDIHLMTDFSDYYSNGFRAGKALYDKKLTQVTIDQIEELPTLSFLADPTLNVEKKNCCNRAYFMKIRAASKTLGENGIEFEVPVLYLNVVNGEFCQEVMLKNQARISHVVKIRYQGPGADGGDWLPNILIRLGVESFITDSRLIHPRNNDYPDLNLDQNCIPIFEKYREQPPEYWAIDYETRWYRIYKYTSKKETRGLLEGANRMESPKCMIR